MMRLAHYSDLHVTSPPFWEDPRRLAGKRLIGVGKYYLAGHRRLFRGADHRLRRLLDDLDAQDVDHALCTGDLTATSLESEFRRCAEVYGSRMRQPQRHTVLPGNHDRYTVGSERERRFERWFGGLGAAAPGTAFFKQLGPGVRLVTVDVARPTRPLDASGLCGRAQLARLRALLTEGGSADDFVIVALHYGLDRPRGFRSWLCRLRDARALAALLDAEDVRVDLVLHGHVHQAFQGRTARRPVVCCGSATDLGAGPGYNIYTIDPPGRRFTVLRRVWSPRRDVYVSATLARPDVGLHLVDS